MSCKKYIAAILLCSVLLAGCSGFSGRGTDAWGAESPASGGSSTEGQAVQVVPETLARQLAAVQSAHPLTEEFFSWCAQEAPSGLLEGIDDRLEAEALYSDAWFYDLCGISLHVLYGRYSGQDSGSNWHEREGSNGAAEIIFAGDVNLDDDWEIMRHLKDSGGGVEDAFSSALLERLRGADVLVVNNEFPYSRRGVALPGKLYTFRADPASTSFLRQMGADLAGLANNHVFDYGPDAFEDTLAALEQEGIPYIGAGRDLEQAMRPQYFIVNGMKLAFVAATRAEKFIFTQEAGQHSRECCAPTNPIFSCKQSQKRGRTAILWRPMCIGARRIPLCWKPLSGSRPANILKRARTLLWAHIRTACRALHLSTESMLHIVWGISGSIWIRWKRASFPSESQRRVSIPFSSSRVSSMEDVPHSWKMQRARRYYSICGRFRLECAFTRTEHWSWSSRSCRERSTNKSTCGRCVRRCFSAG